MRPNFDDINFDNDTQQGFILNTQGFDRFEHFICNFGQNKVEGNALISKFGFATINKKDLENSMSVSSLTMTENPDHFSIENRYYTIKLSRDGSIHSWKDKRTKNFHREICK